MPSLAGIGAREGVVEDVKFVGLLKFNRKVDRGLIDMTVERIATDERDVIRFQAIVWTLGRYDAVALFEAPDEKAAMRIAIHRRDYMDVETLVAVPVEEARELIG